MTLDVSEDLLRNCYCYCFLCATNSSCYYCYYCCYYDDNYYD